MSKVFGAVNIHKLSLTNIPNIVIIIKFIANYIKGRKACTQYNGTLSKLKKSTLEYPKVEFYVQNYLTFTPFPKDVQITTYADDITTTASHTKHYKAQQLIQLYLHKIYQRTIDNLHLNTDKIITMLFTPDPAEYGITLSHEVNNQTQPTTKNTPKLLESF